MQRKEIVAVCSEIHTKHTYTVWAERRIYVKLGGLYTDSWVLYGFIRIYVKRRIKIYGSYLNTQSVPRSKRTPLQFRKTSQLMLYREIMAVCPQIHTKHINTLCGQNVEFVNVKLVVHIVTTGL